MEIDYRPIEKIIERNEREASKPGFTRVGSTITRKTLARLKAIGDSIRDEPATFKCRYGCEDTGFQTRIDDGGVCWSRFCGCELGQRMGSSHNQADLRRQAEDIKAQQRRERQDRDDQSTVDKYEADLLNRIRIFPTPRPQDDIPF